MEKGKKKRGWIIALAIVVLIAVVVTCVIVFWPKNTDNVVSQTNTQIDTMYLKDKDDKDKFESFAKKVNKYASQYNNEVQSAKRINDMIAEMMNFYGFYLPYAEGNGTFQSNYNLIMDGFNSANSYQEKMTQIMNEAYEKVNQAPTFTEGAWLDFKKEFFGYVKGYADAFQGLSKVFKDCVPDGVMHNELMFLILNTVNDYFNVIIGNGVEKQYTINFANTFINKYVSLGTGPAFSYKYSEALQGSVKTINKFSSVYGGQTIKDVIKSIQSTGITFEISEADTENVLKEVKTFLNGGLN